MQKCVTMYTEIEYFFSFILVDYYDQWIGNGKQNKKPSIPRISIGFGVAGCGGDGGEKGII